MHEERGLSSEAFDTVQRIRSLQDRKNRQGGLSLDDDTELMTLRRVADENEWLYW